MMTALTIIVFIFLVLFFVLKMRNMQIWILAYIKELIYQKKNNFNNDTHVYVCLADHFEPYYGSATQEQARKKVSDWVENYKAVSSKHTDSDGRHPQHSYFYPEEEYDEVILNQLSDICSSGLGDVEIHLHHDNDTAENLHKTLLKFKQLLYEKHNLLRKDESGEIVYGFIHGNWALDNSRPDGKWCGIDDELDVLINTGCVYDMTMPSAPSDTQTTTINSIYLAKEDGKCKSHNTGKRVEVGVWKEKNDLLMIQGPLTLNWKSRKFGLIPRIESSELSFDNPPSEYRTQLWEKCRVAVSGAENHIFIKLHTHGLEESNPKMFFENGGFTTLWTALEKRFKNMPGYQLHYVTAWDMFEKIRSIAVTDNNNL